MSQVAKTKVAHTPGPWEARTGRANTAVYAGAYAVAVGCKEADARLIAAVPELLNALRRVDAYLYDSRMPADDYDSMMRDVRALLARINGEEG